MRLRWKLVLPSFGLLLFAFGTYEAIRMNQGFHPGASRYFWWSALRLDSDPLNRRSQAPVLVHCSDATENCMATEPLAIWVDPGWLAKCFMLTDLPALL